MKKIIKLSISKSTNKEDLIVDKNLDIFFKQIVILYFNLYKIYLISYIIIKKVL